LVDAKPIADSLKGIPFTRFGPLAVTDMKGGSLVIPGGESGTDTRVHASAEENDGTGLGRLSHSLYPVIG